MTKSTILAILLGSLLGPVTSPALEGHATIVEGDVIEVYGQRLHLLGAAAPRLNQTCTTVNLEWPCGKRAAGALKDRIGTGQVVCEITGQQTDSVLEAVCRVGAIELNTWLLAHGWALTGLSARSDHRALERAAPRHKHRPGSGRQASCRRNSGVSMAAPTPTMQVAVPAR